MVKLANTTNLSFVDFGLEGSSPSSDNLGDIIQFGRILTLHVRSPGSNPVSPFKAHVTQLVEWNIEAIFVVSSSLTMGIQKR